MRIRNEDREFGMREETLARGTINPTTLSKWRNNTGERGPAMGWTSDPVSRCIIRSKCTGNDVISHQKSRDVLISQSNVCLSLVGPIKGHVWGNKARVA